MMEPIIGIDLGTTHMVVAVHDHGRIIVIPNAAGQPLTPSAVRFMPGGDMVVGDAALRGAETAADTTVLSAKRIIGRRATDEAAGFAPAAKPLPSTADGFALIDVAGQFVSPVEVAAALLLEARLAAEAYLGREVRQAVITVPARFDDLRRRATREAAGLAGLEVPRMISEPTAAAIAHGAAGPARGPRTIAVVHCGGGSFDVAVVSVDDGLFQVRATHGDPGLGGDDFDLAIAARFAADFSAAHGIDVWNDRQAAMRLLRAVERAKRELSAASEAVIDLPYIATAADGSPLHLRAVLGRKEFEMLVDPLTIRCRDVIAKAIDDAKIEPAAIDEVVAVGGGVLVPKIERMVRAFFGAGVRLSVSDPLQAVARGAATYAAVLTGQVSDVLLLDVTSHAIGFALERGATQIVVPRNTCIPVEQRVTVTTSTDNQTALAVDVLQGERFRADGNQCIGRVVYDSIPPAPAGVPVIDIIFDVDANGIIEVRICNVATAHSVTARCGDVASSFGVDGRRQAAFRRRVAQSRGRHRSAALCERLRQILGDDGEALAAAAVAEAVGIQSRLTQEPTPDAEDLDRVENLLGQFELATRVHGRILQWARSGRALPARTGPWRWLACDADRRRLGGMLVHLAAELADAVRAFRAHPLPEGCGRPVTLGELKRVAVGLEAFAAVDPGHWREVCDAPRRSEIEELDELLAAHAAWERARGGLDGEDVQPPAVEADLGRLRAELGRRGRTWWRRLLPGYRRVVNQARRAVPAVAAASHDRRLLLLDAAAVRLAFEQAVARASPQAGGLFGGLWRGVTSDWPAITALLRSFRACATLGTSPSAVRHAVETGAVPAAASAFHTAAAAAVRVTTFLSELHLSPAVVPGAKADCWDDVDLDVLAGCLAAWRDADETPEDRQAFDDIRGAFGAGCFDSAAGRTGVLATLSRLRLPVSPDAPRFAELVERLREEALAACPAP